jgi:acetyl esterase
LSTRLQAGAAVALSRLPDRAKIAVGGGRPVLVDGPELDPGMQLILRVARLRGQDTFISPTAQDPVAERRRIHEDSAVAQGRRTPVGAVRGVEVPGAGGPLAARHYAPPDASDAAPLLVYVHGGGWVVGDLDTHDEFCRLLCRHALVHVLALDYRLAPEHPFPEPVEDVAAALRWALQHAGTLGADPARVAIGGDSAGGNLAAVVAQERAGADGPQPALQVLVYPSVDLASSTRSKELFAAGFYLDAHSRHWCESRYVGAADATDPRISPLRGDLRGVPPAIVLTAAFDPLRDEGEAYAHALREAGVQAVDFRAAGMIHGFVNMTGINGAARDNVMILCGMIRAALTR